MCVFYHAPLYLVKDHFPQTYLEHENMYTAKHDFIIITKTEVEKKNYSVITFTLLSSFILKSNGDG